MFVLEIEFLTGRYAAKQYNDHYHNEWPPHPARVFSALMAAHCEDPQDIEGARVLEREALTWLAKSPAPDIYASEAVRRDVLDAFVPTNDKNTDPEVTRVINKLIDAERTEDERGVRKATRRLSVLSQRAAQPVTNPTSQMLKRAVAVLPEASGRKQSRTFPSVCPEDPIVQMVWPEEPAKALRMALEALAVRVTRLGHSASLIRLGWVTSARNPTWFADPAGAHTLRWVSERQIEDLEDAFRLHGGVRNRVLPFIPVNYRRAGDPIDEETVPGSTIFGERDWIVFELLGACLLPIIRAVDVAAALRGAALAHVGPNPPEALSGHAPAGGRTERPHVAYVTLPFVGFEHADGGILGAAAILPYVLAGEERRRVLRAFGEVRRLTLSPGLVFPVRRVAEPTLRTLDPRVWCEKGTVWGTVTPILLDRFPGDLRSGNGDIARRAEREAEEAIASACERIGLPRPRAVALAAPCLRGVVAAEEFLRRDRRGLPRRVRVHALIDFGKPVRGPVLLGAGRYVGLGLCRPLREDRQ